MMMAEELPGHAIVTTFTEEYWGQLCCGLTEEHMSTDSKWSMRACYVSLYHLTYEDQMSFKWQK